MAHFLATARDLSRYRSAELYGGELRIFGAVDFKDSKVVCWTNYWDGRHSDADLYNNMRIPEESFPSNFKEGSVAVSASQDSG